MFLWFAFTENLPGLDIKNIFWITQGRFYCRQESDAADFWISGKGTKGKPLGGENRSALGFRCSRFLGKAFLLTREIDDRFQIIPPWEIAWRT
jgi:hypothetical protein